MIIFKFLEIKDKITQKTLDFSQNLEKTFYRNILLFFVFIKNIFHKFSNNKNFVIISCFAIIFLSIFLRSQIDIGFNSAKSIIDGQNILQNITKNNFSIFNNFNLLFCFLAQKFSVNKIIFFDFTLNLLAIISLFLSYKIIKSVDFIDSINKKQTKSVINKIYRFYKSHIFYIWQNLKKTFDKSHKTIEIAQKNKNLLELELILITFCFAIFFRIYSLQFNEYFTEFRYFLIFSVIYLFSNFLQINSKKIAIFQAFLAFLIVFLGKNYFIFILFFEIYQFYLRQKKQISLSKNYQNYLSNIFLLTFLALYYFVGSFYFDNFSINNFIFFNLEKSFLTINFIKKDLLAIFLFLIIFSQQINQFKYIKYLTTALFLVILIIISRGEVSYDSLSLIYSFFYPIFFLSLIKIIKDDNFKFSQNWLWISILFLVIQFDPKNFFITFFDLIYLWWILLLIKFRFRFNLIIIALASMFLFYLDSSNQILWILNALIILIILRFELIFKKNIAKLEFSLFYKIIALILIAYFCAQIFISIFSYKNLAGDVFRSPNQINNQKLTIIDQFSDLQRTDDILFISDKIQDYQPILLYRNKSNLLIESEDILSLNQKKINLIKQKIKNQQFKVIFIKKDLQNHKSCKIGFLEHIFSDSDFKNLFNENYIFLTEIYRINELQKLNDITKNSFKEISLQKVNFKYNIFEIYILK